MGTRFGVLPFFMENSMESQIIALIAIACFISFGVGALIMKIITETKARKDKKFWKEQEEYEAMEGKLSRSDAIKYLANQKDIIAQYRFINGNSSLSFEKHIIPVGWAHHWAGKNSYFYSLVKNSYRHIYLSDLEKYFELGKLLECPMEDITDIIRSRDSFISGLSNMDGCILNTWLALLSGSKRSFNREWVFVEGVFKHRKSKEIAPVTLQDVIDYELQKHKKENEMKLVNAGIKCLHNLESRLADGEKLYLNGYLIKMKLGVVQLPLCELLTQLDNIQIGEPYDWTDHLGKGKLCKTLSTEGREVAYRVLKKSTSGTGKLVEVYKDGTHSQIEHLPHLWEPVGSEEVSMLCIEKPVM